MRRKMLTPAFHFKILGSFLDSFNRQSKIMCEILDKQCQGTKKEMDIYPFITRCSLDIICGIYLYLDFINIFKDYNLNRSIINQMFV